MAGISTSPNVSAKAADALRSTAQGLGGSAYDARLANNNAFGFTSQVVYAQLVGIAFATTITNVVVCLATAAAGTAPTNAFVAIYDTAGPTRLALSADLKANAAWASTGYQAFPLTAPYVTTAAGGFYVCVTVNGAWGTTQPLGIGNTSQPSVASGALGANAVASGTMAAQASMPATLTLVTGGVQWIGWS